MKRLSLLGSTGSIGAQTLEVARAHRMPVAALAARRNIALLEQQAREFCPSLVCVYDREFYPALAERLRDLPIRVVTGEEGLCEAAAFPDADIVLNAVVGMIGLRPTLAAIEAKKELALANKETLVAGGQLVMQKAKENGVPIYPVDSEHSAIFQCLQGNDGRQVKKVILTASGGPFYGKKAPELADITPEQALRHPNWSMGAKVTIDSATLMNKGLELIEAVWLFGKKPQEVEIVVHPQSVIHSMVEYQDCAVIAQLGVPDMKIPIQYALTYPNRLSCPTKPLSFADYPQLTFGKPDTDTFRCLAACREAIERGGLYPALVNGANEAAVSLFLDGKISFLQIGKLVCGALELPAKTGEYTVDEVYEADRRAKEYVYASLN